MGKIHTVDRANNNNTDPTKSLPHLSSLPTWSRSEIGRRILTGETLFIYRSLVIRVSPSWLQRHPGGVLNILHFVGRDATDEVDAFHPLETISTLVKYAVARQEEGKEWEPFVPPYMLGWLFKDGKWAREAGAVHTTPAGIRAEASGYPQNEINPSSQILLVKKDVISLPIPSDAAPDADAPTLEAISPPPSHLSLRIQSQHSAAYKSLHERITQAGLYRTRYLTGIGPDALRYLTFALLAFYFYTTGGWFWSAFFLGLVWHQLTFLAHDAGHMGVTHNWTLDRILSIFVADVCGGLSIGWWVDNHNVHHLVTNHPTHDPDIAHLPFFACSPHFLSSIYSSYYKRILPFDLASRIFLRVQHRLFYVVMSLARFNLYRLSYSFLFNTRKESVKARGGRWSWWAEIVGLGIFWTWYGCAIWGLEGWGRRIGYLVVSHVVPSPLHVQIVLSHYSRSTADLGPFESFAARQLRTTVDVICPESLGFLHGGLHLQVTHHLFPRLPRHNLKAASQLVKEFAKEQGLEYAEFGFVEGNNEVRSVLREVANQVRVMGVVAEGNIKEALSVAKEKE